MKERKRRNTSLFLIKKLLYGGEPREPAKTEGGVETTSESNSEMISGELSEE